MDLDTLLHRQGPFGHPVFTVTTVYQSRPQVVQNKMIRYVLNYSNRTHLVANDFNEVKWMSIENGIKYLAASHVFNCIDEQAREYLQVFERVNESHHYHTRHSVTALILPKVGSYGISPFTTKVPKSGTLCHMRSRLRSVNLFLK